MKKNYTDFISLYGKNVVGMAAFATTGFSLFNIATMVVTKSTITHVGVVFRFTDNTACYFEARLSEGFVGPYPFEKLMKWVNSKSYHAMHIRWLAKIHDTADSKLLVAEQMVRDKIGYDKVQLLRIWLAERFGIAIPTDASKVTCSEAVALLLYPEYDLRDSKHPNYDAVTPGSAWAKLLKLLGES